MRLAMTLGLFVLAAGCSNARVSPERSNEGGAKRVKPAKTQPAKRAKPAKTQPGQKPATVVAARSNPIATVPGSALREWSRRQTIGSKRIKGSEIPEAVKAELASLGGGMLDGQKTGTVGKRRLRARWARVLDGGKNNLGATIAFSVGWRDDSMNTVRLLFGVAVDDGTTYRVFGRAGGRTKSDSLTVDEWGFGKDRDIDGDGVADTLVTFNVQMDEGGGAFWKALGIIALTSRGSVARIELESADRGDEDYHEETVSLVACWLTLDGRPALVQITKTYDREYKPKAPHKVSATVYTSDEAGGFQEAKGRLIKTADKGKKAWQSVVGKNAKTHFVGADARQTPDCPGTGEAVLVDRFVYRLK